MLLHKDKEIFTQLIQVVSYDYGLEQFQIEKDYFVSFLLKKLCKN